MSTLGSGMVYVDFDDVLCETARTLAGIVGDRFGKFTAFEDIHSFNLDHSFGLNAAEQEILFALFHEHDVLMDIPPVPGAVEGMQAWAESGVRVHIVTGRPPETCAASIAWLNRYEVAFEAISFVDKYGRGHGDIDGVDQMTLEDLKGACYALAVDDSPEMIDFLAVHTTMPLALFDRPWNKALDVSGLRQGVQRYLNWEALLACYPEPGVNRHG